MTSTIRRIVALAVLALVVAAATGCVKSSRQQSTGKGLIRGINAIATAPTVSFAIEEFGLGSVDFKESTSFNSYDNLSYNFNFDLFRPGVLEADRLATEFIDVVSDTEYTVILTGSIANPSSLVWEETAREWAETDTVFELMFGHVASQVGELDVYFAPSGTVPTLGQRIGTLTFGERLPIEEFEQDDGPYELILTERGDPASIIFQSTPLEPNAQTRNTIVVFDPDPTLPGNVGVNVIGQSGASTRIADINFPSQARTLHAALGTANYDGYLDSNFADLVFSDITFLELSPYADVATGTSLLTLTQVGNMGATIHEADISVTAASRRTIVLAGLPGELSFITLADNARPIEIYGQLRIVNAASNTGFLDVYVLDPGTPVDDDAVPRVLGIPPLAATSFIGLVEGTKELTVTPTGEKTPISASVVVDLANGDRVDVTIVDTVDPDVVELVPFEIQLAP